jgi:hypothetical protein
MEEGMRTKGLERDPIRALGRGAAKSSRLGYSKLVIVFARAR